ncbi:hypothetical protein Goari_011840, partial [Gossypium aridum]|nr:hypothetical protein [Gossypium aridum]
NFISSGCCCETDCKGGESATLKLPSG